LSRLISCVGPGTIHDLLDLAPDLPQELKWGLLDFARALLDGDTAAPSADRVA
jgi:hypothetical protein